MPGRAVFFARVSSASMPGRAFSDRLCPQGAASGHTGLTLTLTLDNFFVHFLQILNKGWSSLGSILLLFVLLLDVVSA